MAVGTGVVATGAGLLLDRRQHGAEGPVWGWRPHCAGDRYAIFSVGKFKMARNGSSDLYCRGEMLDHPHILFGEMHNRSPKRVLK